jgi:hypothetical protein
MRHLSFVRPTLRVTGALSLTMFRLLPFDPEGFFLSSGRWHNICPDIFNFPILLHGTQQGSEPHIAFQQQ